MKFDKKKEENALHIDERVHVKGAWKACLRMKMVTMAVDNGGGFGGKTKSRN